MAKTIRYPNGLILKGVHSRVALLRGIKRTVAGAVKTEAAGGTTAASTPTVPAATLAWSPTIGLTGSTGACGRNYIKGVCKSRGAGNQSLSVKINTVAGVKVLGTAGPAATATVAFTTLIPIVAPGTLMLKGTGVTSVTKLDYTSLKVNDLTNQMM